MRRQASSDSPTRPDPWSNLREALDVFHGILETRNRLPLTFEACFNISKQRCGSEMQAAGVYEHLHPDRKPWTLDMLREAAMAIQANQEGQGNGVPQVTPTTPVAATPVSIVTTPVAAARRLFQNQTSLELQQPGKMPPSPSSPISRRMPSVQAQFANGAPPVNRRTLPGSPPPVVTETEEISQSLKKLRRRIEAGKYDDATTKPASSEAVDNVRRSRFIGTNPVGESPIFLTLKEFSKVKPRIPIPNSSKLRNCIPYILQQIKLWGIQAIQPEVESEYSRMDLFIWLIFNCENEALAEIFRTLTRFHVSLPLLVPIPENPQKFKLMAPVLKNLLVNWKLSPSSKTITTYLFNDPFTLIVSMEVGKSPIATSAMLLNQIMRSEDQFSHGKKDTPEAFVEFTWLTEEVCSELLWKELKKDGELLTGQDITGKSQLILLANFHGDALQYPKVIQMLKKYASGFFIFLMPNAQEGFETSKIKLNELIRDGSEFGPAIKWCHVDPPSKRNSSDSFQLQTTAMFGSKGKLDLSIALISLIKESKGVVTAQTAELLSTPNPDFELAINPDQEVAIKAVENFLSYINTYEMDTVSTLIGVSSSLHQSLQSLETSAYRTLITKFVEILQLGSVRARHYAFTILEQEFGRLTKMKQMKHQVEVVDKLNSERAELVKGQDDLRSKEKLATIDVTITKAYRDQRRTIEIKHFIREVGRLFEASRVFPENLQLAPFKSLPGNFADLVLNGTMVELLDGEISEISIAWLDAVFNAICSQAKDQDLRIFVLSILGLESSGKSTLLNALFGCKFPEAVGPCTNGLFLRILHLDKEYRDRFKVDHIVLIDTEGLGGGLKLGTEYMEQDRLLSTFAMCISDLTLVNILGQSKVEMKGILDIVLVTLARLEAVSISPNILLIQHQAQNDVDEVQGGIDRFCATLRDTIALIDERRDQFVIQNRESLNDLEANIRSGDSFQVFGNFKSGGSDYSAPSTQYHGDVEKLYDRILGSDATLGFIPAKAKSGFRSLHFWFKHLDDYWNAIKSDHFVRNFKNIKEMSDFLERNHQCVILKGLIDSAFGRHVKKLGRLTSTICFQLTRFKNSDKEQEELINSAKQMVEDVLEMIPGHCEDACRKCSRVVAKMDQLFKNSRGDQGLFDNHLEASVGNYIKQKQASFSKQLMAQFTLKQLMNGEGQRASFMKTFNPIIEAVLVEEQRAGSSVPSNMETYIESVVEKVLSKTQAEMKAKYEEKQTIVERLHEEIKSAYVACKEKLLNKLLAGVVPISTENDPDWINERKQKFLDKEAWELPRDIGKTLRILITGKRNSAKRLAPTHMNFVEAKFVALPSQIRAERKNVDRYEDGMILRLKLKIEEVLIDLEAKAKAKLEPKFKYELTAFGIQIFSEKFQQLETEWTLKNQPFCLLDVRRDYFRKQIRLRLLPESSIERRAQYVALHLLKKIQGYVKENLEKLLFQVTQSQKWIRSVDVIRQRYFVSLAMEVDNGKFERALTHFRHPKNAITDWFLIQLDEAVDGATAQQYNHSFFLDVIASFVTNLTSVTSAEDFRLATSYFMDAEIMAESQQHLSSKASIQLFVHVICETISEKQEAYFEEIKLARPSENKHLQSLLGCTAYCPWCGALCWGHKGHETETVSGTPFHHSCHQPRGLAGCINFQTEELVSTPCEFGNLRPDEMEKIAKRDPDWYEFMEFRQTDSWVYAPHPKKQMQDLMKWFYWKLMTKLAEEHGVKPSPNATLRAAGYEKITGMENSTHIVSALTTE